MSICRSFKIKSQGGEHPRLFCTSCFASNPPIRGLMHLWIQTYRQLRNDPRADEQGELTRGFDHFSKTNPVVLSGPCGRVVESLDPNAETTRGDHHEHHDVWPDEPLLPEQTASTSDDCSPKRLSDPPTPRSEETGEALSDHSTEHRPRNSGQMFLLRGTEHLPTQEVHG